MANPIEFRQATIVLCTTFDVKNAETMKGDRSDCKWLQQREQEAQAGCIADSTFLTDMCFAETVHVMLTEYVIEAGISEQ
jgi:hypothetical protein